MGTRRVVIINTTIIHVIAVLVVIMAFFLLGGGMWIRGMMHGSRPVSMGSLNWLQILISLGLGILLGFVLCLQFPERDGDHQLLGFGHNSIKKGNILRSLNNLGVHTHLMY
jgi:hypothetical protein